MRFFDEFCEKYLARHGAAPAVRTDGVVTLEGQAATIAATVDLLRVQIAYLKKRLETLESKPKPPAGVNDEVES